MKLVLIRHGETKENLKEIISGHLPGKSTKEGIKQAKKLALRLKDENICAVYSSDLKRTEEGTQEIIKFYPNIKVEFTKELRGFDLGSITGLSKKDVDWENIPKDVETFDNIYNRAKNFLVKIYKKHKNDCVLLVGHNTINLTIIVNILGKGKDYIQNLDIKNAAVSIFQIGDGKEKTILLNCTKHLT